MEWHRARLLGLQVEACEFDGRELDPGELFRLNFWIGSGGAWRCSLLTLPEAHDILCRVISGSLRRVPSGGAGAGRWAAGTASRIIGLQVTEGRQGTLWVDF